MALTDLHPFSEVAVHGSMAASTVATITLRAPFRGQIRKVGVSLGSALATGSSTATFDINGTAITNGVVSMTTNAGAAAIFTALPTGANIVQEDDLIDAVFGGSGTAGGIVTAWAVIRRI